MEKLCFEKMSFGSFITLIRTVLGYRSQEEFSIDLGVSVDTVSNWERDKKEPNEKGIAVINELTGFDVWERFYLSKRIEKLVGTYQALDIILGSDKGLDDFFGNVATILAGHQN